MTLMNTLLSIGTKVNHSGHGNGVIVAYNGFVKNEYVERNLGSAEVSAAIKAGLAFAVIGSFYSGDRFPYVIKFNSGYQDVYATDDISEIK